MGKFRSKLKRKTKGKHWGQGQSATSNPENKKHRNKARSRFFQPNLSLAPTPLAGSTAPLTLEAISKHDAKHLFAADGKTKNDPTVNDIAMSLKSFNFDDENASESQFGTFKTFKTFASNYSACSNMTFNKFLNGFRQTSDLHKEMLAILAAITEVIKERNGTQSSTEYFLALLETLEAAKEDKEIIALVSLLSMGIKTVPQPVLRKKFADCGPLLMNLLEQFADTENQNVLRSIIGCISVLLRAQEYSDWTSPLTLKLFNQVLTFVIHTKPKIRKASQHAISAIIHGCCFMAPTIVTENIENSDGSSNEATNNNKITFHPAGTFVAKFCAEQFKPENINKSQTVVLHALALLKDTLNGFKGDDIKNICEHLLSIMAASKVLIQTNCFHTLHSLFSSKSPNLSATLVGKLISAIYEYRPERSDVRQTIAWLTVLKQGHICLASFDLAMCIHALPRFMEICATDIWMSDNSQIVSGASLAIKEILLECIKPACENLLQATLFKKPISKILTYISRALATPFGHVASQVVLVFATVFEVAGRHFSDALYEPLKTIAARYDEQDSSRLQIEHTILAAIPSMGPEIVLKAIPLADERGNVTISKSWLLPLLREAITESTFEYFRDYILVLAEQCHANWKRYKEAEDLPVAHTFELLYCQLWGLFPGFCRNPRDMARFGGIAKRLGDAVQNNPEIRAPILDGLKELLKNADDECKQQMTRYAKNFLKRLLNIYATKPTGSYENDIRISAMDVIREYIKITQQETLNELFETAKSKFKSMERMETILTKIQELHSSLDKDEEEPKIDATRQKEIQSAYDVLQSLLKGENALGVEYVEENSEEVLAHLRLVPNKRLLNLFKTAKQHLSPFAYESYFDIIEALAVFMSTEQLKELYDDYIAPTIKNVKKAGVTRTIKERQLKSYVLLKNILSSENAGCVNFLDTYIKQIQKVLLTAVQTKKHNAQVTRLTCLLILIEKQEDEITVDNDLIKKSIPEAAVAFNQAITKQRENIALKLLLKIGGFYEREEKLNDFVDILMAGFGGETVLITNTIKILRIVVQQFTGSITISTLTFILEQVLAFIVCKSRPEAEAAVEFLFVFIKVLPSPYVANHLTEIVKSLSAMVPDTKRFCRLHVGYIWKRLCKRFTAEEIIKLVPGNDEVTHKKLKNIRKELARLKRQKIANEKEGSDEEDDEASGDLKKKSYTIDDILADSDSELENDIMMDTEDQPGPKKRNKKNHEEQKYIQEDADSIFDLADINAFSKITSSKPSKIADSGLIGPKKTKDSNRGFKLAQDGRLIIEEPKWGSGGGGHEESDSNDEDDKDDGVLGDKPKRTIDDSDSEDDNMPKLASSRKRKAADSLSMASGKTGASSKYQAGGKGIHRPLGAASVRSGRSTASTYAASTSYGNGSEFKSKKAQGDVKKKGQKMDPYAYIPLSRTSLNKRKQAKNSGQFKSIVAGARKGAAAGSRNIKKRKL